MIFTHHINESMKVKVKEEILLIKVRCEEGMEIPTFDKQTSHPFSKDIGILKEQKYTCSHCNHVQSDWYCLAHLSLKKKKTLHKSLQRFFKTKKFKKRCKNCGRKNLM